MISAGLLRWVACLSITVVAAMAHAAPADADFRESRLAEGKFERAPLPGWIKEIPVPAAQPSTDPIVTLLGDTQFNWAEKDRAVFVHRAQRANDASALKSLGQVEFEFNPAYQTLRLHTLRIIRDGAAIDRLASAKIRFLERELELENSIYTGMVTALAILEDVRVGDVLEYAYSVEGFNPVMGDRIGDRAGWEWQEPTQLRRISALMPAGRKIRYRYIGGTDGDNQVRPQEFQRGELREIVFEQSDIKPVRLEDNQYPWHQPYAWVQFSEYENWNQVAKWAAGLFDAPPPSGDEFGRIVARLRELKKPARQAIEALNFVQSEIRYTSISLGESSHRPALPDEVLKRRYGDCKDKALLLTALLRAVGLQAEPALASLGYRRGFDKWLPMPDIFDHAIVRLRLNGKDYWLDGTAYQQAANLDTLGRLHTYTDVLVADARSQGLSHIPQPAPEENASDLRQIVRLADFNAEAMLESVQTLNGLQAEYFRQVLAGVPRDALRKSLLDEIRQVYPAAEWDGDFEVQDDREANRLVLRGRYKVAKFATRNDDGWTMFHRPLNISSFFALPQSTKRRVPYALAFPLHNTFRFEAFLPAGVSLLSNDRTKTVRNDYFVAKQTRREKGNAAEAVYELETLRPEVAPRDMDSFATDIRKVREEFRTGLYVGDAAMHKAVRAGLGEEAAFGEQQKERLKRSVGRFNKVIEKGVLSGDDLALAYSGRAGARVDLDDFEGARQDIEQALKINPDHPSLLTMSAVIHFDAGDFAKSAEGYSRALLQDDEPAEIFFRRAIDFVFLGKYNEAMTDLQKALEIETDEERKPYQLLWYAIASARIGQKLPLAMQQRMKESAKGHWPRPLLGVFAGSATPDQVLKSMEAKNGEEKLLNSCEAYFFIGEYYLAKGDAGKAQQSFEASVGTNAIQYLEHTASGHELKRLAEKAPIPALDQTR